RDLDALPWTSWTVGWPQPPRSDSPVLLKWLTAVVCTGRQHAAAALEDSTVRALLGVPPDLTPIELVRWLRRVGPVLRRSLVDAIVAESDTAPLTRVDRSWLSLRCVAVPWRSALASASRLVLRRFAHRLPGFAESTLEHLWRNFLAFDAAIAY